MKNYFQNTRDIYCSNLNRVNYFFSTYSFKSQVPLLFSLGVCHLFIDLLPDVQQPNLRRY
ncbi:hypothetical protein [Calothrix rhizosoleniae]|uniref:hypothetical protein n=1 Tax=Calothrix rhizosoleniae TaxID=888997 RepID=UPI0011785069|nr:hypothetical protein [Calothrix rhizosoleniae]